MSDQEENQNSSEEAEIVIPINKASLKPKEPQKEEKKKKEVELKTGKKHASFFKKFFKGVSTQEKVNFARHLSVATKSGIPLIESLRLIQKQTSSKRFVSILQEIIQDVNNGQSLAQSLENFDYIFGDFFVNIVRVGETSGRLSESLLQISQELKKQKEIVAKVKSAMIYPIIILVATVGITVFLSVFIFPKLLPIFTSLRVELPITTRFVLASLKFISHYGFWVLGGLIVFIVLIRFLLSLRKIHFLFDGFLLVIPVVSTLVKNLTLASFTRSLSVLLKSGMTIVDALVIVKGTFHNLYYRYHIEQLVETVKRGETLGRYLGMQPKLFPPMLVGMIEVGETTGNLDENLVYLSEYYESELDEIVKTLTTVLEPLLLVTMGLIVGFIALSIITPIYKITQDLKFK